MLTQTSEPASTEASEAIPPSEPPLLEPGKCAPPIDGHGLFKSLMLRLPKSVRRSFDYEQLMALRQAAEEMAWGEHPLDIRISIPFPGGHRYLVLIGGRERRSPARQALERKRHPLVRVGNIVSFVAFLLLLAGVGTLFGLLAFVTVLA